MNNKKKLKQFIICLCCVFCSTALTIPYLSYATTQDDLDNANRELESLKAQQQSLSADLSEIDSQLQSAGSRLSSLEEQIDDKQADVDALNEELLSLKAGGCCLAGTDANAAGAFYSRLAASVKGCENHCRSGRG